MRYNIINVNADKKQTFTNKHAFLEAEEKLMTMGYKPLTYLSRKTCVNAYYYNDKEK